MYVLVAEGTTLLERRRYRIPEVKMIPSNLNRCRFEILENNKQTRESTALSVAYNVESVGVGGGRGSWDVVGASQRGRIRTIGSEGANEARGRSEDFGRTKLP